MFIIYFYLHAAEEELLVIKELEAEWAREAQGASDSDDDVELVERTPGRRARGCTVRTCHLRNRSTRAPLNLPIVTFHLHRRGGGGEGLKVIHLCRRGAKKT